MSYNLGRIEVNTCKSGDKRPSRDMFDSDKQLMFHPVYGTGERMMWGREQEQLDVFGPDRSRCPHT